MSFTEEPAGVNPPPELDLALAHLRAAGAPDLALDGSPVPLGGGFWAEMWTLPLTTTAPSDLPDRVVLRLAPDRDLAAWETTLQAGVAAQGYPTPLVRAVELAPPPPHRAWCVMDHAPGAPLLAGLSGTRALGALPRLASRLPDMLARAAADLHRLDPAPISAALQAATSRVVGVDGVLDRHLSAARALGHEPLRRTLERLAANRPTSTTRVVCHGDLHPFNVLAADGAYVVLDWTAGQVAHPAYDLAFTHLLVANPPLAAPRPLRPIVGAAARRIADRFVATYLTLGSHPVDGDVMDWYRTLHACRIMTELSTWRAEGSLGLHRGHPWLTLEPVVMPLLG